MPSSRQPTDRGPTQGIRGSLVARSRTCVTFAAASPWRTNRADALADRSAGAREERDAGAEISSRIGRSNISGGNTVPTDFDKAPPDCSASIHLKASRFTVSFSACVLVQLEQTPQHPVVVEAFSRPMRIGRCWRYVHFRLLVRLAKHRATLRCLDTVQRRSDLNEPTIRTHELETGWRPLDRIAVFMHEAMMPPT